MKKGILGLERMFRRFFRLRSRLLRLNRCEKDALAQAERLMEMARGTLTEETEVRCIAAVFRLIDEFRAFLVEFDDFEGTSHTAVAQKLYFDEEADRKSLAAKADALFISTKSLYLYREKYARYLAKKADKMGLDIEIGKKLADFLWRKMVP